MKNIYVISTDKPSRLYKTRNKFYLEPYPDKSVIAGNQNIYISNDEEIKEGDYIGYPTLNNWVPIKYLGGDLIGSEKKIILTTDQDLIANNVQTINDTFLEWFVNNPSCEFVEVDSFVKYNPIVYQIILPKPKQECLHQESRFRDYYKDGCYKCWECGKIVVEEPKQETIEQAANTIYPNDGFKDEYYVDLGEVFREKFIEGAKWQAERMYSEEEVIEIAKQYAKRCQAPIQSTEWLLEQFKKK
jgi:hypothetical protein